MTTYAYDAVGNLASVTDPLSLVTSYAYDNLYRRTKITDAELGETAFTYDNASRLLTLTDPIGNQTSWQYDLLGRVTVETNELNKSRTFRYDAVGNLRERTTQGQTVDELQWVGFELTSTNFDATFALEFGGDTTEPLSIHATAEQVEAALEALPSIGPGNVAVLKDPGTEPPIILPGMSSGLSAGLSSETQSSGTTTDQQWLLRFEGVLGGINVAPTTVIASPELQPHVVAPIETTDVDGITKNEIQQVDIAHATGGTFTISLGGQWTGTLPYNATADQVEAAAPQRMAGAGRRLDHC